ncbi:hypothetical protein D9M72_485710 [compost metagenome]
MLWAQRAWWSSGLVLAPVIAHGARLRPTDNRERSRSYRSYANAAWLKRVHRVPAIPPPSITNSEPGTEADSSEARYRTSSARRRGGSSVSSGAFPEDQPMFQGCP